MKTLIQIAETGYLPDFLIRLGIRRLLQQRLTAEERRTNGIEPNDLMVDQMRRQPIAVATEQANEQHYELPAEFFRLMLGPHLKYSSCHWSSAAQTLEQAEDEMLALTCERAGVEDGMEVLDLGCGWGSASLWIAARYPRCGVTSVSNSSLQGRFIRRRAAELGLRNLTVMTADVNRFESSQRYDRIVSVEMFEHMRNYDALLAKVAGMLTDEGRLFVHIFCHKRLPYLFETDGENDWMARHFFTGGMMPSLGLLGRFDRDLRIAERWVVEGTHYQRTLLAWLQNLDERRAAVMEVFEEHYGTREAQRRFVRWRLFLLGCAELFGYDGGSEWIVAHYLMERNPQGKG